MGAYARQTLENDMILGEEFAKSVKYNTLLSKEPEFETLPESATEHQKQLINKTATNILEDPQIYKTLSKSSDVPRTQALFERVKRNLNEGGDNYKDGFVLDNIVHTMNLKSYADKSDDEIVAKSLKIIRKHPEQEINLRAMELKEETKSTNFDFSKIVSEDI